MHVCVCMGRTERVFASASLCSCKPKSTMVSLVVQSVVWVRIRIKLDTRQYCVCKVHRRVAPTFWHVNHIACVTSFIHTPGGTTVYEYHPTTGGTPRVSVPACCTHVYGVASVDDSLATSSRYASNQRLVGSLRWHAAHCQLLAVALHTHRHNHRHSHKDEGNHSPSVEGMGGWKKPPHNRSVCHGMPRGGVELHRRARVWRSEREVRIWTLDPHFRQKLRHQLHTDSHMRCCHNAHQALRNRHGHRRNAHAHVGRRGRSRLHHASGSIAAACSRRNIASAPSRCASTSTR